MAGARPEERVALPVISQSWRQVTFLHWRVDAEAIAALLPDGLVPDLVDGSAWVGLTPFRVERFRALGAPPMPGVSSFPETNVRTYVRDAAGRDGLWFLSLDVSSLLNVAGGRAIGARYFWSSMSVEGDEVVRYRAGRLVGPSASHDITVRPGPPLPEGSPADPVSLLTGRWRAFVVVAGRLLTVPVEHQPWPLRSARLERLEETVVGATGLRRPAEDPLVHFSDGVDARLGVARPASGSGSG